jgi:hypothetical protein
MLRAVLCEMMTVNCHLINNKAPESILTTDGHGVVGLLTTTTTTKRRACVSDEGSSNGDGPCPVLSSSARIAACYSQAARNIYIYIYIYIYI